MWISTFHALCARLLRREATAIGLPRDFVIYDSSDQVAVVAVGIPSFATEVQRVTTGPPILAGATAGPDLAIDANGAGWLVTACDGSAPATRLWELLTDLNTYSP